MSAVNDIARALRDRFESDAILGAKVLPVRVSQASPARAAPASLAPTQQAVPDEPALPPRPPVSAEEAAARTVALQQLDITSVRPCLKCGLSSTRTNTVFGVGSPTARIMFIGEAPGQEEDRTGIPFVGRAGELLTAMIEKGMGLKREDVYICNVIKCRPPNNRTPVPDEIASCKGYLMQQIQTVQPEVIIALGAPAAQTLLSTRDGIGKLRGRWHEFRPGGGIAGEPIPLMPTFHPAYLLRDPGEKGKAWSDLKMVMTRLGIPLPPRGG